MNSYRITRGTLTLTGPDGNTVTLGVLGDSAGEPMFEENEPVMLPAGWSGTFTVSSDCGGDVERFFNEMQAEYIRQQLQEAMRDSLPLISGKLGRIEGVRLIDGPALSDALRRSMPAPVHHEPRSKTAQWKRERSPMRYSSRR